MTCINPRVAYKKSNGQYTLKAISDNAVITGGITVPCGQCMPCRISKTQEIATRMVHESYMHKENCFITLTYADECLPKGNTVKVEHMQKFLKKLRRKIEPQKLRVAYIGEYGEITHRAHYHACIFGWIPTDLKPFKKNMHGDQLYTSETLLKTWGLGHVTVGQFNLTTAEYTAKYLIKSFIGKDKETYYKDREPPFIRLSRRPAIGLEFYEKYKDQLYSQDHTVLDGKVRKLPKYYDGKYKKEFPQEFQQLKKQRYAKGKAYLERNENLTQETGLKAVETLTKQRIFKNKRDVE